MTSQQRIITLNVVPASAENLAPFGEIIGPSSGAKSVDVDFYKGAISMSYPARFECDHPVEITMASMSPRPFEVRYMERHFQHTQAFIPLGSKPFIAVMAPATDGELPDPEQVRAFLFDGQEGFSMHRGTWHEFPFALEDETNMLVLLSSQTGYDLHNKDMDTEEAFGPDLDKKDIRSRTGTLFRFTA